MNGISRVALGLLFLAAFLVVELEAQEAGQKDDYAVSIGSLIDTKVLDRDGKELGNLKQIMADPQSGKIKTAIISVGGGILGLKQGQVISVPWEQIAIKRNKDGMFVSLDREIIQQVQEQRTAQQRNTSETADRQKADRAAQKSSSETSEGQGETQATIIRERDTAQKDQQGKRDLDAGKPGQAQDRESVRKAQQALKEKGFDPGAVNGVMDDQTQQALKDFQKANGLTATGMLDEKTKKELGIEDTAASSQPEAGTSESGKKTDEPSPAGKETNAQTVQ